MDITTVTVPAIKAGRWGGVYAPMERAMAAHGVDMIGDPDYRQKNAARFTDAHGEMRPASLGMGWESRGLRTLMVRRLGKLGNEQIEKLHEYERRQGYFVVAIEKLFRLDYKPEPINDERLQALRKFNNEHRPILREVFGIRVMAYFPSDMEFDGMDYHHAWDKCVLLGDLVLPEIRAAKRKKTGNPIE